MKCYALARRFGTEAITWFVSQSSLSSTSFFINQSIGEMKQEITWFLNAMQPGAIHFLLKDNYFLHALKVGENYCAIICDTRLTPKQMTYLCYYLLMIRLDLDIIALDLPKYSREQKIEDLAKEVNEIKEKMRENIAEMMERGDKIEDLLIKTETLEEPPLRFNRHRRESTSCFCTLI
jgi:hypothetical protein